MHLLLIFGSLYTESDDTVVEVLISLFAMQFLFAVSRHVKQYSTCYKSCSKQLAVLVKTRIFGEVLDQ